MFHLATDEDMHVHSTFSDGKGTVFDNIDAARTRGLRRLGCVDHVRATTTWVPGFVDAVARARATCPDLELVCGLEAKLLDERGRVDAPADWTEADWLYVADHQLPLGDTVFTPRAVRALIGRGLLAPEQAVDALVDSLRRAIRRYERVVIAHPFSILPKLGLSECAVGDDHRRALVAAARRAGACFEVSERWRCPSQRLVELALEQGVAVWMSSDSHRSDAIGQYDYCTTIAESVALRRLGAA